MRKQSDSIEYNPPVELLDFEVFGDFSETEHMAKRGDDVVRNAFLSLNSWIISAVGAAFCRLDRINSIFESLNDTFG